MFENKLEKIAIDKRKITARLNLSNIGFFSFDLPLRATGLSDRLTLADLFKRERTKAAIEKAATEVIRREYGDNLLEMSPDLDAPISLTYTGAYGIQLYNVACTYQILLKPDEEPESFGD